MKHAEISQIAKGELIKELREAIANYMYSEGCTCCQAVDSHREHKKKLAELLNVPMYEDGSGYDFFKFRSNDNV